MIQEDIATMNPVVIFPGFMDIDVAASQSDVQLLLPSGCDGYVVPCDGYIIGLTASLNAAASAGSLTIGVSIDGTEVAATTQTVTTGQEVRAKFAVADRIHFLAGQQIGVEITTDGSWNATTADLSAEVYAVLEDWDF